MFTIKGRFSKLSLGADRFTQTLDTAIRTQIRQAAREWLRAVILRVPIWTGTSIGSLQPLGAYLKVAVPSHYEVVRKGYGPSVGRANQEFQFGREGNIWFFSFTEEVPHYLVNEYFNANLFGLHLKTPGPYKSFEAGENAFQAYMDKNLVSKVPKIEDYVITKDVRIDT